MSFLPTTGIGIAVGLASDGLLGFTDPELTVITSAVPAIVSDDGGEIVVLSGVFPIGAARRFYLIDGAGASRPFYSGIAGQGTICRSTTGTSVTAIVPKFAVGGPYSVLSTDVDDDGVDTGVLSTSANLITVVRRSFSTPLYSLRKHFPDPRAPGAMQLRNETYESTSIADDLLKAVVSSIADEILFAFGYLLTRTTAAYTSGGGTLTVEGTDRFPATGSLVVPGGTLAYTGKTATTFTGVTGSLDVEADAMVVDASRTETQLDQLRSEFFIGLADSDAALNVIGQNNAFPRPRGVGTELYRQLLSLVLFGPSQTTQAIESALTVLHGAGNFEIWEDPAEPGKVFVKVPQAEDGSTLGKSYLLGQEEVTAPGGSGTLTVQYPPVLVYGVYDVEDLTRSGTNYLLLVISGSTFDGVGGVPARLNADTPGSYFVAGDVGASIIVSGGPQDVDQGWQVATVVDADSITCVGRSRYDATLLDSDPDVITCSDPAFAAWMGSAGARVQIQSTAEDNDGTFEIAEVISPWKARLTGAAFVTEINVAWRLLPNFSAAGGYSVSLARGSVNTGASTVTVPNTLAAGDYLVDYRYTRSDAQLRPDLAFKRGASPLYLFDHAALAAQLLDILVAAGIMPVFPEE